MIGRPSQPGGRPVMPTEIRRQQTKGQDMRNPFTTPDHEDAIREKRAERGVSWEQYASEIETNDRALAAWMRRQDDDAPADEAPADEAPADEAPADEAPADEAVQEEPPAEPVKPARERAPRGRKAAGPNAKA